MIGVVDYGVGNTGAFFNMYKHLNLPCKYLTCPMDLDSVDQIILPGVGSFDFSMSKLNASGMRDALGEHVIERGKPVLGICVGMQMFGEGSDEGKLEGLNWIPGNVRRMVNNQHATPVDLPHMGWNKIAVTRPSPLLDALGDDSWFYFLHSYRFECENSADEIANCEYGEVFSCAVNRENIFGVQFHPEKSHEYGSRVLRNFSEFS